jgi:hypothetical protein
MNSLFLPDTTEKLEEKSRRYRNSRSIQRWVFLLLLLLLLVAMVRNSCGLRSDGVQYRECAEDGHKGLVPLVCGYRFFFLTRELPSFLCDFFSSFALFFPPFVVELEKQNKKTRPSQSDFSPFFFSFKNVFLKEKKPKKTLVAMFRQKRVFKN